MLRYKSSLQAQSSLLLSHIYASGLKGILFISFSLIHIQWGPSSTHSLSHDVIHDTTDMF